MNSELLTTDELSARIKYDVRTIRERLKDSVLLEGVHYFRPFGGRKILYVWNAIERDMMSARPAKSMSMMGIPMELAQGEAQVGFGHGYRLNR